MSLLIEELDINRTRRLEEKTNIKLTASPPSMAFLGLDINTWQVRLNDEEDEEEEEKEEEEEEEEEEEREEEEKEKEEKDEEEEKDE